MPSGAKCHSPALTGKPFCYYHSRQRTLVVHNLYRMQSVQLPPLEDRGAIQLAINEVVAALAARKINRETANTYLYAIQLASANLARTATLAASDPVRSISTAHWGQELAGTPDCDPGNAGDSKLETCLADIDRASTHEYEREPLPEPVKRTPEQQRQIDGLCAAFNRALAVRDRLREQPSAPPGVSTP